MSESVIKGVKRPTPRPATRSASSASTAKSRKLHAKAARSKPLAKRTGAAKPPVRKATKKANSPAKKASSSASKATLKATKGKGGFALDTETTGVDPTRAELVGLSFSWKEKEAWYVPVNRDPPIFGGAVERARAEGSLFDDGPTSGDAAEILRRLQPVLEDASIEKTGQNAKYDAVVLAEQRVDGEPVGVDVRGVAFDTMVADFCLRPDARTHNPPPTTTTPSWWKTQGLCPWV